MIDKKLIPVNGLKKEPFSGSHRGMRYLFQGDDGKSSTTFTVFIYPEPWCFEQTPDEKKESAVFPLTEEGMDQSHGSGRDMMLTESAGLTLKRK